MMSQGKIQLKDLAGWKTHNVFTTQTPYGVLTIDLFMDLALWHRCTGKELVKDPHGHRALKALWARKIFPWGLSLWHHWWSSLYILYQGLLEYSYYLNFWAYFWQKKEVGKKVKTFSRPTQSVLKCANLIWIKMCFASRLRKKEKVLIIAKKEKKKLSEQFTWFLYEKNY